MAKKPPSNVTTAAPAGGNNPRFEKDMGLGTGLLPVGDVLPGPAQPADGSVPKPPAGESTFRQATGFAGIGFSQLPGFVQPLPGTYLLYRRMSSHPTLALAKSIVTAPIMASSWSYEVRRPDGKPTRRGPVTGDGVLSDPADRKLADRAATIQSMFDPMRSAFLWEALRCLETGWRPFEKIWDVADGQYRLTRLKPLLPDFTWIYIDKWGNFNGITQMDSQLGPAKSMVVTYDGEAGNLYGRSRHENVRCAWHNWHQVEDKAAQLATKAAAIIPVIHYPMGQSQTTDGGTDPNYTIAVQILNGLSSGKGITIPNLFANADDPRASAELAGKSSWVISFLEAAGAATNLSGMTDRQRYYDQLMFRGWLRSERTGMEAQTAGSRADSEQHSDTGITDSSLVHANICEALSRDAVNDVLALNCGRDARDSVYITPAPLQDAKRALYSQLFAALWANPQGLPEFLANTDMDAVFDLMEIPKANSAVTFKMPTPPVAQPGKPGEDPAKAEADAGKSDAGTAAQALSMAVELLAGGGDDIPAPTLDLSAYKFSSTQIDIPEPHRSRLLSFAKSIPDAEIDPTDGREADPHVTVKYGLHADDVTPDLQSSIGGETSPVITLGNLSVFPADAKRNSDVLKVDVHSPDLHRLNRKVRDCADCTDTHPTYHPHLTLAYLKPGEGAKYAGMSEFAGLKVKAPHLTFSSKSGTRRKIGFKGE